jgi:hypothetical protein
MLIGTKPIPPTLMHWVSGNRLNPSSLEGFSFILGLIHVKIFAT